MSYSAVSVQEEEAAERETQLEPDSDLEPEQSDDSAPSSRAVSLPLCVAVLLWALAATALCMWLLYNSTPDTPQPPAVASSHSLTPSSALLPTLSPALRLPSAFSPPTSIPSSSAARAPSRASRVGVRSPHTEPLPAVVEAATADCDFLSHERNPSYASGSWEPSAEMWPSASPHSSNTYQRRLSALSPLLTFGLFHTGACDQRDYTANLHEWRPTTCTPQPFDANALLTILHPLEPDFVRIVLPADSSARGRHKNILFVGDSITGQLYASLLMLALDADVADDSIAVFNNSIRYLRSWILVDHLTLAPPDPVHHRYCFCLHERNGTHKECLAAQDSPSAAVQAAHNLSAEACAVHDIELTTGHQGKYQFEFYDALRYVQELEWADVLVLNTGHHTFKLPDWQARFPTLTHNVVAFLDRHFAADKHVILVQSPTGHNDCKQYGTPNASVPAGDVWSWNLIDEAQGQWYPAVAASSLPQRYHVLSTKPLAMRPDGHLGSKYGKSGNNDCLHWCWPGALDIVGVFLYNTIMQIAKVQWQQE